MIYELESTEFYKCQDLANRGGNIEEKAIVAGINPGRIFVDHKEVPRSALVWQGNLDGFIFIGDSTNHSFNTEINDFIIETITPQARALGIEWFECIGNHSSWYSTFEEVFKDRELKTWNQNVYTLTSLDYKTGAECEELGGSYRIEQITDKLLGNPGLENMDFLKTKIEGFWSDFDKFLSEGLGYCVLHENTVVSVCHSGYRYRNFISIDIETVESYRGKKLAQQAVHSFVRHCFANGLYPYWDCMESNLPSNALAKRIGFVKEFSYRGYEFRL